MDPCPFFRLRLASLSLKLPSSSSDSLYYCKIKLPHATLQTTALPLFSPESPSASPSPSFTLTQSQLLRINRLTIDVYARSPSCLLPSPARFIGRLRLPLDLSPTPTGLLLLHNGWFKLKNSAELHLALKLESDPRFLFQFGAHPELSPQVFQLQPQSLKQPVFSCNFALRNPSSASSNHSNSNSNSNSDKDRKGWMVTIHDLSGSPVAAASMVTPFVPSPGSDRVSRSNPGAWLILRPADSTWAPWGRLEAWCDSSSSVAYRFEILSAAGGITLSTASVSARSGGVFDIDIGDFINSPVSTPSSSFDLGSVSGGSESGGWMYGGAEGGFVMSSTVGGERAEVQVGAHHVTCTEDAAVFVALAAAADLSVHACLPFSKKLRKELTKDLTL